MGAQSVTKVLQQVEIMKQPKNVFFLRKTGYHRDTSTDNYKSYINFHVAEKKLYRKMQNLSINAYDIIGI